MTIEKRLDRPAFLSLKPKIQTCFADLDFVVFYMVGCQFWSRTFEEELSKVDVAEIRQLIDEDGELSKKQSNG